MLGAGTTVKLTPLLETPLTVTMTFPVDAPLGTVATILLELQLVTVAVTPLNVTVPCVLPNDPLIVTEAPIAPDVGDRLEMLIAACARLGSRRKQRRQINHAATAPRRFIRE